MNKEIPDLPEAIEKAKKRKHQKDIETCRSYLHHLFLSLDIDMQALEDIAVNEKRKYLKEMYSDDRDYLQKLLDLQYLVNGLDNGASEEPKAIFHEQSPLAEREGIDKQRLLELSGIENHRVCQFFEMLDRKEEDCELILRHDFGGNVLSFHKWFIALDSCLRGGCK